jgi:hypothetical protein
MMLWQYALVLGLLRGDAGGGKGGDWRREVGQAFEPDENIE